MMLHTCAGERKEHEMVFIHRMSWHGMFCFTKTHLTIIELEVSGCLTRAILLPSFLLSWTFSNLSFKHCLKICITTAHYINEGITTPDIQVVPFQAKSLRF